VPRLKAADLPALTATGAVSEAMADMVAETWTRARGVAERALETRQLRVGARARVQVENGYVRIVGLQTLYEETKKDDQKTTHSRVPSRGAAMAQ
jgi:hypothetical protein